MIGRLGVVALMLAVPAAVMTPAAAEVPDTIAAKGQVVVVQFHAEGAQIYQCEPGSGGLTWQFREPIAALFNDGRTVGRHYAGPSWESGGSIIVGKATGRAPGSSSSDIPWLRLEVSERRGDGPLKDVTTIQRINTKGGSFEGTCEKRGELHAQPYAADYVFLRKAP